MYNPISINNFFIMKRIITKILATLGFICLALPFVNAQTGTVLLNTNFEDWKQSAELPGGIVTDQANGTYNLPDTKLTIQGRPTFNNASMPNAGTSTEYPNYFRFGSDGTATNQYLEITPDEPFVNGGRITVVVSTNSSASATNIFYVADASSWDTPLETFNQIGQAFTTKTFDLPAYYSGTKTIRLYRLNTTVFLHAIKIETNASGGPILSSDATLKSINVRGIVVAAGSDVITVDLPYTATEVPTLVATPNDSKATVTKITDAANLTGATGIEVTAEDGTTKDYSVIFNVLQPTGPVTTWNFTDFDTNSSITATETINCLTIAATPGATV